MLSCVPSLVDSIDRSTPLIIVIIIVIIIIIDDDLKTFFSTIHPIRKRLMDQLIKVPQAISLNTFDDIEQQSGTYLHNIGVPHLVNLASRVTAICC